MTLCWRHSVFVNNAVQHGRNSDQTFLWTERIQHINPADYRICGLIQERVYKTPSATWSSASLTHGQAYHRTSSSKLLINRESGYMHVRKRKDIPFNTCGTKTSFFITTTPHQLFSEPPTVYRGKHVTLRHFCRRYLKANKVMKSKGSQTWTTI